MAIDPTALSLALSEWQDAPKKARTATLQRLADRLGVHPSTLYRAFNTIGHRGAAKPRDPLHPERRDWADILYTLSAKVPDGTLALDLCLSVAVQDGLLPPEAADVRVSEYARLIRQRGYRQTIRRGRRLSAEYPMQAVQFDASTSKRFRVLRQLDDGADRLLEIWHRPDPASGYKNKPLGEDRERLILYGQWDMCTGYRHMAARAALGESGLDAMDYLVTSWVGTDDPRDPYRGKPEDLWTDQGPLTKYPPTADLLQRLDVALVVGQPYDHTRQKGIETGWRTVWSRFEGQFFLRCGAKEKWTIRLSDYQAELTAYRAEQNDKASRCDATLSRRDAWTRLSNQRGGTRPCPADALETLATEVYRVLDSCGVFSWDKTEYEVPKYYSRRVIARRAVDGTDRVIVEIPETGERLEAKPHRPVKYGEWKGTAGQQVLPHDRAKEAGATIVCPTPFYGRANAEPEGNVVHLPPRAQPAAELADPLAINTSYRNLTEAMEDLHHIYTGTLDATQRTLVEQAILNAGLNRQAVRDLALQLCALAAAPTTPARPTLTVV